MTEILEISKVDIATSQLGTAIQLYIDETDLVSSVTLAGAAEEILGKLISAHGTTTAFEEALNRLCEMHKLAFEEEPDRKVYADLRNGTRNEFKHLCSGKSLKINLDGEASQLINRAINNYRKLFPGFYPRFKEFEQEWLRRHG
jgi:hypothetical protein